MAENNVPYLNSNKGIKYDNTKNIFSVGKKRSTALTVSDFYEVAPFPNYNDYDNVDDLLELLESNAFLQDLKHSIGFGKSFLEVGSGTCQLSVAMAARTNNDVVALDPTRASLELGAEFARKNNVSNVMFVNADLFDDPIKGNAFDYVWCSGVLHHTENTELGLATIVPWLKPNGILIIGLYNRFGRFRTHVRQFVFKLLGKRALAEKIITKLDPYLRKEMSVAKKKAWLRDQYLHPVERSHTIDEVLHWFDQNNIEFLGSIPDVTSLHGYKKIDEMCGDRGDFLSRLLTQIGMIFSKLGAEGGLFILVGKKKS